MPHRDLIVVGASAGGVEALQMLVAYLPNDLAATVLVVLHGSSALAKILSRASARPVSTAQDGDRLEPPRILVAPAGSHLLVHDDHVELTQGPRVNGHRPAIDPLFLSAAEWRGPRAIGVILSGTLDDGSAGMRALVRSGGPGLVQDPAEAVYSEMPLHALRAAPDCEVSKVARMGARLGQLTKEEVDEHGGTLDIEERRETEQNMRSSEMPALEGKPSAFSCPDCHGVLWELSDGEAVRYRCRVGHAFSPATLSALQEDALEEALWTA
ncbi:MAG: chemotaxis protein CheB, partial [Polyangiaceae bacterium]